VLDITAPSAPSYAQTAFLVFPSIAISYTNVDKWHVQIELVEEQTGNMDPRTNFKLIVIQTELERFKYLVRSFLRARIAKVIARLPGTRCPPYLANALSD